MITADKRLNLFKLQHSFKDFLEVLLTFFAEHE